jgi:voltage-gated sodium channel
VKEKFDHPVTQIGMAALILINFMIAAVEAQIKPLDNSPERAIFDVFDWFFNMLFLVELLINMYANFFIPFWKNLWNIFDTGIVVISMIAMFGEAIDVTALRLFRAFRRSIVAFRVVKLLRLKWVKMIVLGVLMSLPGVSNAFVLLGLVMGIWSIMGVSFYGHLFPDEFGNFFKAMLTMLQVMSFDSWSSGISRPIILHEETEDFKAGLYFVTYVFASAIIMANVVLAILIDKFLSTANMIQEQNKAEARKNQGIDEYEDINNNPLMVLGEKIGAGIAALKQDVDGPLTAMIEDLKARAALAQEKGGS